MNKLILITLLILPTFSYAGLLGFLGDVSSISSAMNSGKAQPHNQKDLEKINKFLWWHVENNKKLDGYQFLAEALEKSNRAGDLDTVARTYYINGDKAKAIEIYETRVLPTARATCKGCDDFYKKMIGLSSNQEIPYSEIYEKQQQKIASLMQKEELKASQNKKDENTISNSVLVGILVVLILNLLVNIFSFVKSKKLKTKSA